jgi:cell wall-associated NlpC family hydrolase
MAAMAIVAAAVLATGCASSGTFHDRPRVAPPVSRTAPPENRAAPPEGRTAKPEAHAASPARGASAGDAIAQRAVSLVGAPYRDGGTTPDGFDCSGFVLYVVKEETGVALPRGVSGQYDATVNVPRNRARPGDLVFFKIDGRHVSHVALIVDDDTFVHAPSSRGAARVRVDHLSNGYWNPRIASIRRVAPTEP